MSKLTLHFTKSIAAYFISGLSLLVTVLGVLTVKSVVGEPPAVMVSSPAQQLRAPASLAPIGGFEESDIERFRHTVYTVDLGCLDKKKLEVIKVRGHLVRVTGRSCLTNQPAQLANVANRTNGVKGTTFSLPGNKGFSTNYMRLKEGANNLLLEFKPLDKKSDSWVSEITLQREIVQIK